MVFSSQSKIVTPVEKTCKAGCQKKTSCTKCCSDGVFFFLPICLTNLCSWCVAAGWGSWRWGRRCARTPTCQTGGRNFPRSPPICLSPASRSPASGPSLAPCVLLETLKQRSACTQTFVSFRLLDDLNQILSQVLLQKWWYFCFTCH